MPPRDPWTPDRRRGDRRLVPFELYAQVRGVERPVPVRELAPGGMVIAARQPVKAGERLTLTIVGGERVVGPFEGRVAHSRLMLGHGSGEPAVYLAGIAFAPLTAAQAACISTWLAEIDALT